jgi:hypothetical protein
MRRHRSLRLNAKAIVHVRGIFVIAEIDDCAKFPTEIFDSCPGPGVHSTA